MLHRVTCLVVCLLFASPAFAQSADERGRVAARELAQEGAEDYQRGDFENAVDKLERAYRIVDAPTVAVWYARALAKTGRLVEASERYLQATRWSGKAGDMKLQQQAQADAQKEREELMPRIPRLTITVQGAEASSVELTLDGEPLPPALMGVPQPVDPGTRTVVAKHAGKVVEKTVSLTEGARETVVLGFDESAGAAFAGTAQTAGPQAQERDTGAAEPGSTQRTIGLVVGGIGVVGLGVAGFFTLRALSKKSDSDEFCEGTECTSNEGVSLRDDAVSAGNVATIAGIAGAVALGVGVVLYLTAPSGESVTALAVHPVPAGATLSAVGAF